MVAKYSNAQSKMNLIVAELLVPYNLTIDIPPAAVRTYKLAEDVLVVYSVTTKKFIGPFILVNTNARMITGESVDGSQIQTFTTF